MLKCLIIALGHGAVSETQTLSAVRKHKNKIKYIKVGTHTQ